MRKKRKKSPFERIYCTSDCEWLRLFKWIATITQLGLVKVLKISSRWKKFHLKLDFIEKSSTVDLNICEVSTLLISRCCDDANDFVALKILPSGENRIM